MQTRPHLQKRGVCVQRMRGLPQQAGVELQGVLSRVRARGEGWRYLLPMWEGTESESGSQKEHDVQGLQEHSFP